ncbi:hypothetical protein ALC57_09309 [Trachymyrmex cornetzi]|uniref:DNA-directed DNA polymerase n=1 Tax=Trachymyrmex cornetzi TaxID=471704 RepID=A0A151J5H5_9HYME|nr:hypothetical protein ALC57_09309 [Trachymyrmex cornetzi]
MCPVSYRAQCKRKQEKQYKKFNKIIRKQQLNIIKMRKTIKALRFTVHTLKNNDTLKKDNKYKTALQTVFTDCQIKALISKKQNIRTWSNETIERALQIKFVCGFNKLKIGNGNFKPVHRSILISTKSILELTDYLISKLKILRSEFSNLDAEDFDLLTRKRVFPYEYIDSVDKLNETSLPPRELFYSSLTDETASDNDYQHATNVWRRFCVETLGNCSDLYLKTDVLLLADVFENFRDTCIESYGLDPAHYYTLSGYTWVAMLKYTGIRFELLTDIDMVMFVERGIRGGLSQCSHRYAQANNKYNASSYDPSEPSTYLMYFDVNNLYGWAMSESLPYGEFQWVDDIERFDVMSVASDSVIGYILEVDLAYPQSVHDAHVDLPFCPIRERPPGKRNVKLLATLYDKERYVVYYRNLQQCIHHGLRITKIYRILQFAQSPWLRGYIELNTRFRMLANNEFEKNLYKLMNNAVFGKTMENVRDHVDVRLITRWDGRYDAEAMIAKPNFHSRSIFSENLIAVELRKLEVKMDKPIYVGMCILEIAKLRLYEFHYEYKLLINRGSIQKYNN